MNNWIHQRKYDGRRTFYRAGELWSKSGIDQTERYPHIIHALKTIDADLDGEICILPTGTAQNIAKKSNWPHAVFVVFDVTRSAGRDMKNEPLSVRIKWLEENLPQSGIIQLPEQFDNYDQAWATVLENNWEGLVKKNLDSVYAGLGSFEEGCWEKIKYWKETLVEIIDFKGNDNHGSFILAHKNKKGLCCKLAARSYEIIERYKSMIKKGRVFADINYLYMTASNSFCQPSLTRLK